ncbi:RiPP maturation radical SAM C-methyltransferase [Micromonospora rubida]|uniref:RiPP maturation radical SAM C-methyltransferase n=1 Tax=Micromonospora rubida TaxID=2697657 RepID=UPI00137852FF|nr:RiPP maturation radical SAM C-methyltransferase [Micromonospora rubida]NBE83099.1 RiPP maturation radical SAM protein 1 [Micromonospora rubida]
MKIVLTAMPWHGLQTASLPVGILKACADRCRRPHEVVEHYANLGWADLLDEESDGAITPDDYAYIANVGVWHSIGEWVFASALYEDPSWRTDEFLAYLADRRIDPGKALVMRPYADKFIDMTVDHLLGLDPDLVGFTTTFSQNTASLAVARRLKRRRPSLPVVIGGGNCEGPMGPAMSEHFPYLDYVVSGEGENAFVALVDALDEGGDLAKVPGLIWRTADGNQRRNPPASMIPMTRVPRPDYDGWQSAFAASRAARTVTPELTLEAARGCWWGEKHHCTFCGLNGTTMVFRAKPASDFLADLTDMVARHRILDVVMVDNIMSNDYFRELLPVLRDRDWDVTIRYEVKANLRADQLAALADAGVRHIQPGIESLSSHVLTLMEKGVHATQNIQVLRDADDFGLTVDWNMLYGFPGESDEDYQVVLWQLPALVHLQPPAGMTRILLERFSPYFERPELGFVTRRPARQYRHVYALAPEQLYDLAYQFEGDRKGLTGDLEKELRLAVRAWGESSGTSSLVQSTTEHGLLIEDRRHGWPQGTYPVSDPLAVIALQSLRTPRSEASLLARLTVRGGESAARRAVDYLTERGLVFAEGGRLVALPTAARPLRPVAGVEL